METSKQFEIDPEPFKYLIKSKTFNGETETEFIEYLDALLDRENINDICTELDELGYLHVADALDMLLYSGVTETFSELGECWIENIEGESSTPD